MKLSEAIRKGAKLRPQGYDQYFTIVRGSCCSCAIRAALEFEGSKVKVDINGVAEYSGPGVSHDLFPALRERIPGYHRNLFNEIAYRNDQLKQTREQIADWLEQQGY